MSRLGRRRLIVGIRAASQQRLMHHLCSRITAITRAAHDQRVIHLTLSLVSTSLSVSVSEAVRPVSVSTQIRAVGVRRSSIGVVVGPGDRDRDISRSRWLPDCRWR